MISAELHRYIDTACDYASRYSEPTTSLVHILLSILDDVHLQHALARCGISYLDVRQGAIDALATRIGNGSSRSDRPAGLSALALYAIQSAQQKASARSSTLATVMDLVAAVLEIHDNGSFDFQARVILSDVGLTVSAFAKVGRPSAADGGCPTVFDTVNGPVERTATFPEGKTETVHTPPPTAGDAEGRGLPFFCMDMTTLAREGRYDRSYGREAVLDGLQVVLARRKKRSAILIGEPGVGKTSVVEELACRIAEGSAGPKLVNATLISLDLGALVSGTKYRGELEERIRGLLSLLSSRPEVILFVDEIHALVSPQHSAGVAADLLKPALASGAIRCIGATTLSEYKKYFEADAAMSRRFASLIVPEPTRDEAVAVLERAAPSYALFHSVELPRWSLELAVDLSIRLMPDRRLPDKALELLDAAAARAATDGLGAVTREMFEASAASMSGRVVDKERIDASVAALGPRVREIADAARRNEAARCGKGEVIRVVVNNQDRFRKTIGNVANALSRPYEFLDMAEFRDPASVTSLLGPPPGYVGFENGGRLYDIARRSPDCILHIANIEHCHQDAISILEECREAGYVRDTTGRIAPMSRVQLVVSVGKRAGSAGMGFSANRTETDEDYGIALVDDAETIVVLDGDTEEGAADELIGGLVSAAAAAGVSMTVAHSVFEFVRQLIQGNGREGMRRYSRLVRRPVLDYLVSRAGDFSVESCGGAIRIIENEA